MENVRPKLVVSDPGRLRRPEVRYVEGDDVQPANLPLAKIEHYAGRVSGLLKHRVGDRVEPIVEKLGGRIVLQDVNDWLAEDGSIFVHAPFDFEVMLTRYTSAVRDQFTVAHELGHYFLHSRQGQTPLIAYRRGSGRREWEANSFAAALLMPAVAFKKASREGLDVNELAARFNVSRSAAQVRKEVLNRA